MDKLRLPQQERKRFTKEEQQVKELITFTSKKQLEKFLMQHAATCPCIVEELEQFLFPFQTGKSSVYRKKVKEILSIDTESFMDEHDDFIDPLTVIVEELDKLLDRARFCMKHGLYGETLEIIFAVMDEVALSFEKVYDHGGDLIDICREAASLVEEILFHNISEELIHKLIDALKNSLTIENFEEYELADMNHLILQAQLKVLKTDEALLLLSSKLTTDTDPYRNEFMVHSMLALLKSTGKEEEYQKVVDEYLHLPGIRQIRIDQLMEEGSFETAIQLLDEGIALATEEGDNILALEWKETRLHMYRKMGDREKALQEAQDLFYTSYNPITYYYLLKEIVDARRWPVFLEELLHNKQNHPFREVNSTIYIEEQQWEELMRWVEEHTSFFQPCDAARPYAGYLMAHYPQQFLEMYRIRLSNYAYSRRGREHYRFIAETMEHLQTYPEGKTMVKELAAFFQTHYKNRRAFMDEIKHF